MKKSNDCAYNLQPGWAQLTVPQRATPTSSGCITGLIVQVPAAMDAHTQFLSHARVYHFSPRHTLTP